MSETKKNVIDDLSHEKIGNVKGRLLRFIQSIGISTAEFERSIGVGGGYVSNISKSIQPDKLEVISEKYPSLSIEWLLINNGEMIKDENTVIVNRDDSTIIIKGRVVTELIRVSF